jgi:transposase-like protein
MAAGPEGRKAMGRQRSVRSGEFKAKVALEAMKGQHTVREIASRYSVHSNMAAQWKKQATEELLQLFDDGRAKRKEDEHEKAELYEQIGRLKMELEWLKKVLAAGLTGNNRDRASRISVVRQGERVGLARSSLLYCAKIHSCHFIRVIANRVLVLVVKDLTGADLPCPEWVRIPLARVVVPTS